MLMIFFRTHCTHPPHPRCAIRVICLKPYGYTMLDFLLCVPKCIEYIRHDYSYIAVAIWEYYLSPCETQAGCNDTAKCTTLVTTSWLVVTSYSPSSSQVGLATNFADMQLVTLLPYAGQLLLTAVSIALAYYLGRPAADDSGRDWWMNTGRIIRSGFTVPVYVVRSHPVALTLGTLCCLAYLAYCEWMLYRVCELS
jgi:hypothetical protein